MTRHRPLLCILVDAFRHDYLAGDRAPFLTALAARSVSARMRPILGYSDSIRATIFTGAYPDEHGYWMEYCYRPEAAPMRPLSRLAALDALPSDFVQRGLKFGLSHTAVRALARRRGYEHLSLRHFPFRSLGSFDWTLRTAMTASGALGAPTLFDDLTHAGMSWSYLDASRDGTRGLLRRLDRLAPETSLAFVYLHHIDMASHLLGLDSSLFGRVVRRTDGLAAEVVKRFGARFGEHELVVFSDHGMSNVEQLVAYPELWRHPAFPERFCFALDATMVRLWFHDSDPSLRDEITARVGQGAPGHFLSTSEVRELHLDFGNRLYGDEIYLLEPRVAIFPNFHSMLRPKAMHAYHPDDSEQQGIFIASDDSAVPAEAQSVELVDVHRVSRRLLGLSPHPQSQLPAYAASHA